MDRATFLVDFLELLQREEDVSFDMRLSSIPEWDSLAQMVFIAYADTKIGKKISLDKLSECLLVDDLFTALTR